MRTRTHIHAHARVGILPRSSRMEAGLRPASILLAYTPTNHVLNAPEDARLALGVRAFGLNH